MEKHGNNTYENAGGSLALWQSKSREGIDIAPKVVTMAMDYDKASSGLRDRYEYLCDYVRYREIELLAEHLEKNRVSGAIAEAGVDMGQTSVILNALFPERRLYLYDTFDRFPQEALDVEVQQFGGDPTLADRWQALHPESEDRIAFIRKRCPAQEQVYFRKGVFPQTAEKQDADETFAFVLLDMDLYQSTLDGIRFFYPRMTSGGYLMLHDYNTTLFKGAKAAVEEAEREFGRFFCACHCPIKAAALSY